MLECWHGRKGRKGKRARGRVGGRPAGVSKRERTEREGWLRIRPARGRAGGLSEKIPFR